MCFGTKVPGCARRVVIVCRSFPHAPSPVAGRVGVRVRRGAVIQATGRAAPAGRPRRAMYPQSRVSGRCRPASPPSRATALLSYFVKLSRRSLPVNTRRNDSDLCTVLGRTSAGRRGCRLTNWEGMKRQSWFGFQPEPVIEGTHLLFMWSPPNYRSENWSQPLQSR